MLLPGVNSVDPGEFDEFFPEFVAERYYHDQIGPEILQIMNGRHHLDRIAAECVVVSERDRATKDAVFGRIHDYMEARCRTPRESLSAEAAVSHASKFVAAFQRVTDEQRALRGVGLSAVRLDPNVEVVGTPEELPSNRFRLSGYQLPGEDSEQPNRWAMFKLLVEYTNTIVDNRTSSGLMWGHLFEATRRITNGDETLRGHLFQPVEPYPIETDSYYSIWAGGGSVWWAEGKSFVSLTGAFRVYRGYS